MPNPASTDEELFAADLDSVVTVRSDAERVARMAEELAYGFLALANIGTAVSVSVVSGAAVDALVKADMPPFAGPVEEDAAVAYLRATRPA